MDQPPAVAFTAFADVCDINNFKKEIQQWDGRNYKCHIAIFAYI